jgi:serine/threonine-protein kinase
MAYKREQRYPTAAALAEDLERLMAWESPPPTSASVASFLRSTFGEERYTEKTRIPTLATLMPGATILQAQPDSKVGLVPSTPAAPASPEADKTELSASMPAGGSSRRALLLGAVAGVLLLAGGAFVLGRFLTPPPPPSATAPSPPAAQPAPPPADTAVASPSALPSNRQQPSPEPAPSAAPDTQQAVAQVEAPSEEPLPPKEPIQEPVQEPKQSRTGKTRPVVLSAADIQRKVSGNRARMMTCFDQHKSTLPSNEGEVKVRFIIYSSGRTKAETQGPLGKMAVGQCLERQLERLRFPAHRDGQVEVNLPFAYRVTR